jgi:hypothetical protein
MKITGHEDYRSRRLPAMKITGHEDYLPQRLPTKKITGHEDYQLLGKLVRELFFYF